MIKSNFYLIRGDNKPIYVGYTNRPIKRRFDEHKKYKDFSHYNRVTIEKIDELSYDFTWNEQVLYKNANEVSIRESNLILKYGTQDSEYQKAVGGGQTWGDIKYFVKHNKNNPLYLNMSKRSIDKYLRNSIHYLEVLSDFSIRVVDYVMNTIIDYANSLIPYRKSEENEYFIKDYYTLGGTIKITKIVIALEKTSKGQYRFSATQNSKLLYYRYQYIDDEEYLDIVKSFSDFLNKEIRLILDDDPGFIFNSISDFGVWINDKDRLSRASQFYYSKKFGLEQ